MPYKLKLTSPTGETRRLTFNAQPSWTELQQKIASLFGINDKAVAVSYEDGDGDIITMSSQEELDDYFQTAYKHDEVVKFLVVDKSRGQRSPRKNASAFVEGFDGAVEGGLPTIGPTMFIEVDDEDWQRLPRIPEMFGIQEEEPGDDPQGRHAFVEVVDSDADVSKKGSARASPENTPMSTRQLRHKGKEKATTNDETATSTSVASVIDEEAPTKPSIHVYDASRTPSVLAQDLPDGARASGGPDLDTLMGSYGNVYPANPPQDAFKQVPRATDFLDSESGDYHGTGSVRTESAQPIQQMTRQAPSNDIESAVLADETNGSRTPRLQQTSENQPCFVHDVATLVDNLTNAFASHPELSEGLRNIIQNAVRGRYWTTERERVAGIAENVRIAAEETSTRIAATAGDMANNAERDAVRTISEALGGIFRVIGDISGTGATRTSDQQPAASPGPVPPTHHDRSRYPSDRNGAPRWYGYRQRGRDPHLYMSHRGPDHEFAYRPAEPSARYDPSWQPTQAAVQAQRSNTWGPGNSAAQYFAGPSHDDVRGGATRSNLHETKVQLEAAKAIYKAEKERFRQEKEERRRLRREYAEKRAQDARIEHPDGTTREEEIIARIPFRALTRDGPLTHSHGVPPGPSNPNTTIPPSAPLQPVQAASHPSPRRSTAGTAMYSSVDPVPAVPPPPIPAPVDTVSSVSTVHPIPPPPPPPPLNVVPPTPGVNPPWQIRRGASLAQPGRTASGSGPYPWPVPPERDPLRRRHLATLRERIQARLFDMGITPSSQPDMMDILNAAAERTDTDDDEVLADVLAAMNIRGSPSPRVKGSGLPR